MKISTINYIREQNKGDEERAVEQFTAELEEHRRKHKSINRLINDEYTGKIAGINKEICAMNKEVQRLIADLNRNVAKKKKEVKRLNDEMVKMHKLERKRYLQASDVIRKKYNLDKMSDAR